MAVNPSLEDRLAAVEATIAELKQQMTAEPTWLQQIIGSFKDVPDFEAVLAYGRAIRQEDFETLPDQ